MTASLSSLCLLCGNDEKVTMQSEGAQCGRPRGTQGRQAQALTGHQDAEVEIRVAKGIHEQAVAKPWKGGRSEGSVGATRVAGQSRCGGSISCEGERWKGDRTEVENSSTPLLRMIQ